MSDFYQLSINTLQGNILNFNSFRNKVVLIINTASLCSLTPQLKGFQKLHAKYLKKDLVILACPCNQFGNQEPGNTTDIQNGCLIRYDLDFVFSEKIEVNGKNSHPVFIYLKKQLPGIFGNYIKWNFTKFLIDKKGIPVKRFSPIVTPKSLEKYIVQALNKPII
ncbi:glutathione peroxidase [Candidatus Photodesmus anomalopis]|uniref:Glutathione peroxidase n=1 Tax=Candidatus Photodesmus katoptron Akat1 TaxID=1236703 RepID=S3DGA4_9GAMM|nr:glutathione peroxidase [Candidatus Photodesmus katoptron]EPE37462.1 glutathione peroxidase [Candidatus Photodesmus katoptron Akat1]